MRHNNNESHLVTAFAEGHGISQRAAQLHRKRGSPEWSLFLSTRKAIAPTAGVKRSAPQKPVMTGLGLDCELTRMKQECFDLANRLRDLEAAGLLSEEQVIHKILDSKRETLRKLAKDEPDVAKAAGDVVERVALVHYAADICTILQTLPARISTMMPVELAGEIRQKINDEIGAIMTLASQVQVRVS